jgi:hypothetical protein
LDAHLRLTQGGSDQTTMSLPLAFFSKATSPRASKGDLGNTLLGCQFG